MYTEVRAPEHNSIIHNSLSVDTCGPSPHLVLGFFYGLISPDGFSKPQTCVGNSIFITNP